MNSTKLMNGIKYFSITAILAVIIGILWGIFRPQDNSDSFLIMNKDKVSLLSVDDKKEISNITVDDNFSTGVCSIKIDLGKLSPQTDTVIDQWLRKNSANFCYEESYPFIEKNHIVPSTDTTRRTLITGGIKNSESFNKITDLIPDLLKPNYGEYINFNKNSNGKIVPQLKKSYSSGDVSLSVPTICSIININKINPIDYDVTYSLFDHDKHIGLIITERQNPTNTLYYNYSTDPTKPSTTMTFNPNFALY